MTARRSSAIRRSNARIAQYEMAFRMQIVGAGTDGPSKEPEHTFELYGRGCAQAGDVRGELPAGAAAGGARRALHPALPSRLGSSRQVCRRICRSAARRRTSASAALIQDLKQRGMLDDTLVVWGGEFGRTVYCQGRLTATDYGRDHHPRCFTMWMAGGGIKPGVQHRRDGRLRLQHHEGSGPRARSTGDDSAVSGDRSHAADVQVSGSRFPIDGCRGECGEGDSERVALLFRPCRTCRDLRLRARRPSPGRAIEHVGRVERAADQTGRPAEVPRLPRILGYPFGI